MKPFLAANREIGLSPVGFAIAKLIAMILPFAAFLIVLNDGPHVSEAQQKVESEETGQNGSSDEAEESDT